METEAKRYTKSQVRVVCIFCGHNTDKPYCPHCNEYKGIVKAQECLFCGDWVPVGEECYCEKSKEARG